MKRTLVSSVALLVAGTVGPIASPAWAVEITDLKARLDKVVESGEAAKVLDLLCETCDNLSASANEDPRETLEILGRIQRIAAARYEEVFRIPDSIREVVNTMPILEWPEFLGPCIAFGGMWTDDDREVYGSDGPGVRGYLTVTRAKPYVFLIDLDLDGRPEITVAGPDPVIADGLEVAVDRAEDGLRAQWLIAGKGADPRQDPVVWLYRDGSMVHAVVRIGRGGNLGCGRSRCLE